jgi:hypothetical protein
MPHGLVWGLLRHSARLFVVTATDQNQVVFVERRFRVDDGFRAVVNFTAATTASICEDAFDVAGTDAITDTPPRR